MKNLGIALCAGLYFIAGASAGDLSQPFELDSASTLPNTINTFKVKYINRQLSEQFNSFGDREPLAQPILQRATWNQFYALVGNPQQVAAIQQAVNFVTGGGESAGPGSVLGEVTTSANVAIPMLARGISKKVSVAIAVPVYRINVRSQASFATSSEAQTVAAVLDQNQPGAGASLLSQLDNAVETQLNTFGYESIGNKDYSAIGDIKAYAKYKAIDESLNRVALRAAVTLPTGRQANADSLIDVPTGDGQADFEGTVYWDHFFNKYLTSSMYLRYNVQFEDQIEKRIPFEAGNLLSPDKETVNRNLGDQASFGFIAQFGNLSGFSLGMGYDFQYMFPTSYQGSQFTPIRYSYLEGLEPSQTLHTMLISAGYSTVSAYRSGKFAIPIGLNVSYSRTLTGRNVVQGEMVSAELYSYF